MGQFERTLTVADDRSFVEYLEECTVPSYHMNQLDAAVVELHCNEEAEIKYLTVQNWYPGNENGTGEEKDILKLLSTKQIGETCDTLSLTKLEQLIAFRTAAEHPCRKKNELNNGGQDKSQARGINKLQDAKIKFVLFYVDADDFAGQYTLVLMHVMFLSAAKMQFLLEHPRTTPTAASKLKVLLHEDKLPANSVLSRGADGVTNKDKGAAGRKRRPHASHTMLRNVAVQSANFNAVASLLGFFAFNASDLGKWHLEIERRIDSRNCATLLQVL
ncbi:SUF system FeS cluster assembly, SufB [Tanacetum coccineum]